MNFELGYGTGAGRIDNLISEHCREEIKYRKLETLGSVYSGLTGKQKSDFGVGNARFITYKNVYNNISIDLTVNDAVRISSDEKQNKLEVGDVLFTASSETLGEVGISSVVGDTPSEEIYLNSFCFGYRLNDKASLIPGFLKYIFRSNFVRQQIIRTASGVTRFNISKKKFLNRVRIPIPPVEIQHEIVDILDKFDALVNDLSIGLPAEINARRKQYEYYRDRLLTFKEAV
ncbi:MAG: restriction endonuclease subunit S [Rhodothermaceae bacterium]|nr:restriction endonuclease subunit S [Rhodothermaceae bacterium]